MSEGYRFSVLHFATHGTFDVDAPLKSAILLANDTANNGLLTAGDLYRLQLNADLVTLSGCETGLGKVSNGDDVIGFTRGLLYAGASTIVSSLWQVDDATTSKIMQLFYSNMVLRNNIKSESLRNAQLAIKKLYTHPFYWSPFQLTGNAN